MTIKKHFKNHQNLGYYMPLFNLKGLKSAITPFFAGDLKTDYHHYALEPVSELELFELTQSRNVIFEVNGQKLFLNGQTELQQQDDITYETGLLYQRVTRENNMSLIKVTSFIPLDMNIECHEITYKNSSNENQTIQIITATPIYGRSADSLRDHRHVTSLLHQIKAANESIIVKPTLSFDERGHKVNDTTYALLVSSDTLKVKGYIPTVEQFLNGGSFHFPQGLNDLSPEGYEINGYEAMGGLSFQTITLKPNEEVTFYMGILITTEDLNLQEVKSSYLNTLGFSKHLQEVSSYFAKYINHLTFNISSKETSNLLTWVTLQPLLRRYFGNSFLPYHDYGKGGRGWRDLWQDLLSLIMMNDTSVFELLYQNFAGIRIDGSNATIIGEKQGEFLADRNQITRVWSDHGVWPLITSKLYIDETGDLSFLLKKQTYFSDQFTHYTKKNQLKKTNSLLKDPSGQLYEGTILEHLLIENLVGYHHIGEHGFTRLEDADWNDGLDMARELGETIAFTHMYAENLNVLSQLIGQLDVSEVKMIESLELLLQNDGDVQRYFDEVANFNGKVKTYSKESLVKKLQALSIKKKTFLNAHAFQYDRYDTYYDKYGKPLDSKDTMQLTGQAMALLGETPTHDMALKLAHKTKEMLFNAPIGGYHLNSNYHKVLTNMGRAYGFAYNHKENGAIFSHMVMMYAYGLYQYGLVKEGREAVFSILDRSRSNESKMWAGIPEYFNEKGEGKYPYLTGSASWLLLLLRKQIFGLVMDSGKLLIKPKLMKDDFINYQASIETQLFNQHIKVTYHNPKGLDYPNYQVKRIESSGKELKCPITEINGDIEVYLDEII
ncbi:MAG: hypothetical protein V3569_00430 [Acholeplasmataceae bacterium]